jgi:hypothetical protein
MAKPKLIESEPTGAVPLRAKRAQFVRSLARLILWANEEGLELGLDEGAIVTPRRIYDSDDGTGVYADARYPQRSYHYLALAQDLFLFRDGEHVTDHTDPSWLELAERWETIHPLCTSGARRIGMSSDSTPLCRAGIRHFSFDEATKVYPLPWRR